MRYVPGQFHEGNIDHASIMAGAAGYLLKDTNPGKLIEGIEAIARGGSLLDPVVTQTVLSWMQRPGVQVPSANPQVIG
jgi:DNA-binding NarL/FixJ family response regulator